MPLLAAPDRSYSCLPDGNSRAFDGPAPFDGFRLGDAAVRQKFDVASFIRLTDMGCEAVIVTLPAVSVGPYELAEAFETEMFTAAVTSS